MRVTTTMMAFIAILASAAPVEAQGIVGGARSGAATGKRQAGPVGGLVGGIVGGVVGGVVGGARGVLGLSQRGFHHTLIRGRYRHHRRAR